MIWLYAITDELRALPAVDGIDGAPLTVHAHGEIDVVATVHDGVRIEPSEERVLAHARVVDALVPLASSLIPARFGTAFDGFSELEQALREHDRDVRGSLEIVRGGIELALRVVGQEPDDAPTASTGREYLEARYAQVVATDRIAGDLHACLAEQARAAVRSSRADGRLVLSSAYLLDADAIPSFQKTVGALESKHPELTFALTGPWPPYSFAGLE